MGNAWVQRYEAELRPTFERIAGEIRAAFPHVKAIVWSAPVGKDMHSMGVDCLFGDAPLDAADNISLAIELAQLTGKPQLRSADVAWGHPSGRIEADAFPQPLALDESALERLKRELPALEAVLKAAVARGEPSR